ncbi:MAG: hypothetical protein PVF83_16235 [Anaerolineales bacterium]|jgi:uncharacterized protein YxjI
MEYNYPLEMSFKIVALAPQMSIRDADGNLIFYVKQKLFKLKEEVTVFADSEQTQTLYKINADRVIDFSARYSFSDAVGNPLGAVKRQGMKSLWKAHYDVFQGNEPEPVMTIQEENVWIKVADGCLNSIPVLNLLAGYFFHPAYLVANIKGIKLIRLQKMPAFFESKFMIEKLAEIDDFDEKRILLSLMMMTLLERARG